MHGCFRCNVDDPSNYGYWTITPRLGTSSGVYCVYRDGRLFYHIADVSNTYGVRPVITISKNIIS